MSIGHVELYLKQSIAVVNNMMKDSGTMDNILSAGSYMRHALQKGGKIISCGNGGSMCDAMHFASELTGKYDTSRDPLPAIALSDVAAMTCISNDFGYNEVFSRQVMALGQQNDMLLAISTSGASESILRAMATANSKEMRVIGLTSIKCGSSFRDQCEICIEVPSLITNHIQEVHIKIIHILVELIERDL